MGMHLATHMLPMGLHMAGRRLHLVEEGLHFDAHAGVVYGFHVTDMQQLLHLAGLAPWAAKILGTCSGQGP